LFNQSTAFVSFVSYS